MNLHIKRRQSAIDRAVFHIARGVADIFGEQAGQWGLLYLREVEENGVSAAQQANYDTLIVAQLLQEVDC